MLGYYSTDPQKNPVGSDRKQLLLCFSHAILAAKRRDATVVMISYPALLVLISLVWISVRLIPCMKKHVVSWKRELQLMLVYICIIVVVRFTFFPFSKVNGQIQPLVFDPEKIFPFRINLTPLVYLFDYPVFREALRNLIGNTAMFLPLGIVWPLMFRELNTHRKVLASGFCFSLIIEILQLPFFDRVSDIDDLILNTLGFTLGYGIYLIIGNCTAAIRKHL